MAIHIKNLNKSFGRKEVLRDVNLTLEDAGIYCLMGVSGMGKTTLLRILMGLETKDSGTVEGILPGDLSVMFQEDRLSPVLTPVENVALVHPHRPKRSEIAAMLGEILPKECLKQPCKELSGGMKRRVSLARAMFYPSKYVFLDEPFTGLDTATKQEVIDFVLRERKDRTLLVVTHGEDDAELLGGTVVRLEEINALQHVMTPESFGNPEAVKDN